MKVNEERDVTIARKAYGKVGKHPMAGKTLQFKVENDEYQENLAAGIVARLGAS